MLVSWTIPLIYQDQILRKYKKGVDRSNKKKLKKLKHWSKNQTLQIHSKIPGI